MNENQLWVDHLGGLRRHVFAAIEGLDDAALTRPVLPSGWSCLDLVHHVAEDAETFWIEGVVTGDATVLERLDPDSWTVPDDVTPQQVLERYRAASARADAIVLAADLDAGLTWWPDFFGEWRMDSVREVLMHVHAEVATHTGHLDAARELIDGRQHVVVG